MRIPDARQGTDQDTPDTQALARPRPRAWTPWSRLEPRSMTLPQEIAVVIAKDLRAEWRARSQVVALLAFAAVVLLLFSFAVGPDSATLARHAGGYLWLAMLLASTLSLARSMQIEVETGALEAMLLAPPAGVSHLLRQGAGQPRRAAGGGGGWSVYAGMWPVRRWR